MNCVEVCGNKLENQMTKHWEPRRMSSVNQKTTETTVEEKGKKVNKRRGYAGGWETTNMM